MLVTYAGAIATLRYSEIPIPALKGSAHLHTTSFFLQEALRSAAPRLHEAARRLGLTTSFDPNTDPADEWGEDVWPVIERADLTFMNAWEARRLTLQKDLRRALRRLAEASRCVVIQLGPGGAVALRGKDLAYSPGFVVPCVDTTGAGDSFDAGFVSAFVEALPLGACLDRGNVAGALSATGTGGTAEQPTRSTVERFLKEYARRRMVVPDRWLQAARTDLG
jgi:sugar/nucleoside kinase (ribokinase family)